MKNVSVQIESKLTTKLIGELTMSTVEIAELTGKRHDNVMRKAEELASKGIINAPQIEERYNKNNTRMIYRLNKTESLNLVANLSPEFTAAIIDRWQVLENQQGQQAIREDLLKHKRLAQKTWSDALKENRELLGKETKSFHYSNENLMLNEIVLGERRSFAEDELSPIDVQQLEEARTLNGALIKLDTPYKERKAKLMAWGQRLATIALSPTT